MAHIDATSVSECIVDSSGRVVCMMRSGLVIGMCACGASFTCSDTAAMHVTAYATSKYRPIIAWYGEGVSITILDCLH